MSNHPYSLQKSGSGIIYSRKGHSINLVSRSAGNFPVLPLRTRTRGPAYTLPTLPPGADLDVQPDNESYDCVDEIISLFRANVLFRNFEINGPADRMLIYGTLFITECLGKVKPTMTARDAEKVVYFGSVFKGGLVKAD